MPINVLHKFDTVFSADCLEFNPSNQSILALGTYQILDPSIHESTNPDTDTISKTNRTGKLYLFDTLNDQL